MSIVCSCDKENGIKECIDNKYYVSFSVNGEAVCFDFCGASLFTQTYAGNISYSTSLIAGETTSKNNDTLIVFPGISITFPDTSARTYSNDDIKGLKYFIQYSSDLGSFFFPSLIDNSVNEYFELTITKYDLENHILSGTFHGKIFNTIDTSAIVIENGIFESNLYKLDI
jgi:hypothetical protein